MDEEEGEGGVNGKRPATHTRTEQCPHVVFEAHGDAIGRVPRVLAVWPVKEKPAARAQGIAHGGDNASLSVTQATTIILGLAPPHQQAHVPLPQVSG